MRKQRVDCSLEIMKMKRKLDCELFVVKKYTYRRLSDTLVFLPVWVPNIT